MNENEARKCLPMFADVEQGVKKNLQVLEHIVMNPEATSRVMHQQQLRQRVNRSIQESTPTVLTWLDQRLREIAEQTTDLRSEPTRVSPFLPRMSWRLPPPSQPCG